jgi:hypothetical protein
MSSADGSDVTRIGERGFRRDLVGSTIGFWYWFSFFLPLMALHDVQERHPPPLAVAADVVIFAVLIWSLCQPWYMGVRIGDRGITVRNYFRTCRVRWAEVTAFADGTTDGNMWVLAVMLGDGRGVTATATRARRGSPAVLTAVRQAAARRSVPATVTGIAAERPRAWLDAASQDKRQRASFAAGAAVTVIAGAGTALAIRWGSAHGGSYSPAGLAGSAALVGLGGVLASAWRRR